MFTESSLRKIKDFSTGDPIVSLYLNTEPSRGNAETHRLRLRNMIKDISLRQDAESIEKYFAYSYDWTGRSVAVFSSAPAGFFHAIPLAVPVKDFIQIGSKAAVDPLEDLLEEYSNLGVILVDKQGARLFHFHLGELVEQEGYLGDLVKHVKSGSASSAHGLRGGGQDGARTVRETIDRNQRDIAEAATRFLETKRVRRILLGGTDENVSHFRNFLPKSMQSLIVGTFAMAMTANSAEVMQKVLQTVQGE
ncbi:MAG TPA: VLRF1 family aeRF1-type release factor [Anaerolineaceae bacterium]|nr:VLRF1 family aeRF1-type release factor [Anaerolineaceae bacterium]